jgi:hypothetical protein
VPYFGNRIAANAIVKVRSEREPKSNMAGDLYKKGKFGSGMVAH